MVVVHPAHFLKSVLVDFCNLYHLLLPFNENL